jgi:hypothetical protein
MSRAPDNPNRSNPGRPICTAVAESSTSGGSCRGRRRRAQRRARSRPTTLTPELQERLVAVLRALDFLSTAAPAAGSPPVCCEWVARQGPRVPNHRGASGPPGSAPALGPGCPRLLHDGVPAGTPDPTLVPADLSEIVRLVAGFLDAHGQQLRAGDWILSGACTAPVRVAAGERVEADFDTLGGVAVRFAPAAGG